MYVGIDQSTKMSIEYDSNFADKSDCTVRHYVEVNVSQCVYMYVRFSNMYTTVYSRTTIS